MPNINTLDFSAGVDLSGTTMTRDFDFVLLHLEHRHYFLALYYKQGALLTNPGIVLDNKRTCWMCTFMKKYWLEKDATN